MRTRDLSTRLPHQLEDLGRRLFELSPDPVLASTPEGQLLAANPAALSLLGCATLEELLALEPAELFPALAELRQLIAELAQRGVVHERPLRLRTCSGTTVAARATLSLAQSAGSEAPVLLCILREAAEMVRSGEPAVRGLRVDPLTRLPNRAAFYEQLALAVARARRFGRRLAVMLLDLDGFGELNSRLGHATGDALLGAVAERLERQVRKVDTLARLGGDGFGVIKTDFERPDEAAQLAHRLGEALAAPFELDGQHVETTVSIGIAMFPPGQGDPEHLVRQAELALYQAQSEGKGGLRFHDPDVDREVELRMSLAFDLRGALARGELFLEYQPQVDLADQRVSGVEALLRWRHPRHGVIAPTRFLAIAEATGTMAQIGAWVLETTCAQVRAWQRIGPRPISAAVNLSACELKDPDLAATVGRALQRSGLAPGSLELELSESSVMRNPHAAARTFERLRRLGVRLALDHFGTGFSSFEHLRRTYLDRLKIDPSFIHRLGQDAGDTAAVAAVIAMARKLGLHVVASGVETRHQLDFLSAEGCNEAQGFLLCEPLPPDRLEARLAEGGGRLPA